MGIHIGNNNKLKNVIISENTNKTDVKDKEKNFFERHPILLNIFCSLFIGVILLFGFWKKIVNLIENIF